MCPRDQRFEKSVAFFVVAFASEAVLHLTSADVLHATFGLECYWGITCIQHSFSKGLQLSLQMYFFQEAGFHFFIQCPCFLEVLFFLFWKSGIANYWLHCLFWQHLTLLLTTLAVPDCGSSGLYCTAFAGSLWLCSLATWTTVLANMLLCISKQILNVSDLSSVN